MSELEDYKKSVEASKLVVRAYHEVFGIIPQDEEEEYLDTPTGLVPMSRLSMFFD